MNPVARLIPGIRSFRPFLPAKNFETSLRFQGCYVKEWVENTVMHVLVDDVQAWWQHIHSLDLENQFGVSPVAPSRVEPWGLTVAYVFDPAGVLWHFAEVTTFGSKET